MAGDHLTHCPGCHERELYVHQTESKDVRYCQRCGFEDVVVLERRRAIAHPELSSRVDRNRSSDDEGRIRPLKKKR
jgi:hypothetical protein